ncbi:MAG TPA: hypothetical protein DD856_08045 [Sulfobacillus sp.]|nr:hypothetical protein [Sulfobacillus sp.]
MTWTDLSQTYRDALNAFNYADTDHIDDAIARLAAAEQELSAQLEGLRHEIILHTVPSHDWAAGE